MSRRRSCCCGGLGACCWTRGCSRVREAECLNEIPGGVWRGLGTTCPDACLGACCVSGSCSRLLAGPCYEQAGALWLGLDSDCIPDVCTIPSCCTSSICRILAGIGQFIPVDYTLSGTMDGTFIVPCPDGSTRQGQFTITGTLAETYTAHDCMVDGVFGVQPACVRFTVPNCSGSGETGFGARATFFFRPEQSPLFAWRGYSSVSIYGETLSGPCGIFLLSTDTGEFIPVPAPCDQATLAAPLIATARLSGSVIMSATITGRIACLGERPAATDPPRRRILVPGIDFIGGAGVDAAVRSARGGGRGGGRGGCAGCGDGPLTLGGGLIGPGGRLL